MTAEKESIPFAAAEWVCDVGNVFFVFFPASFLFLSRVLATELKASVKVTSHDRAPPEASQIDLYGDFRRCRVVATQRVHIEPAVVVEVDELPGP